MMVCADSFLFVFTVLPIRGLIAIYSLIKFRKLHAIQKTDLLKLLLIIIGILFLRLFHMPSLSIFIKKESLLKLKIFFTILELMDKMLCSFGENILGSLYWSANQPPELLKRSHHFHFILGIVYIIVHATFLLFHISVLDVAINSKNNTLWTLLLLVQFAEVKSAALKDIARKKLEDMCAGDIVERFQLLIYLILLFFYNVARYHPDDTFFDLSIFSRSWMKPLLLALLVVYLSELLVDWIKHTSIVNFVGINPHTYTEFSIKFSRKLTSLEEASFLTDRSQTVFNKMGLVPIALAVLVLRIMSDWITDFSWQSLLFLALIYVSFLVLRKMIGVILVRLMRTHQQFPAGENNEKKVQ
eukprot:TRINITY_DN6490_c0_g1_i1.p1 TRINITY_DN6490_c0_g1~~TRINITY_DN6490_c0_g1_i1.p1  ORF type:complete len:357 (-),score=35.53 TRINITY_DN6490_c0_g1_i1:23-1093(-)